MPGKVVAILVEVGQAVRRGTALILLEAMKMEHTVAAPADGIVARVDCSVGELVGDGAELLVLEPPQAAGRVPA
jgi:3-methylcrotonyl-CoA carboxylase alpha subunit